MGLRMKDCRLLYVRHPRRCFNNGPAASPDRLSQSALSATLPNRHPKSLHPSHSVSQFVEILNQIPSRLKSQGVVLSGVTV